MLGILVGLEILSLGEPVGKKNSDEGPNDSPSVVVSGPRDRELIDQAARALNTIDRSLEEWGRASVSQLVLFEGEEDSQGKGPFDLDYSVHMSSYVDAVRTNLQGKAGQFTQRDLTAATKVRLSSDKLGAIQDQNLALRLQIEQAGLKHALQDASSGTNRNPSLPTNTPPVDQQRDKVELPAPAFTGNGNLSETNIVPAPLDYQKLLEAVSTRPSLSEGTILRMAASAKMTELVLNYMSDPGALRGKKVFFALTQVSLNPGWRTKHGYVGEAHLTLQYGISKGEIVRRREGPNQSRTLNECKPREARSLIGSRTREGDDYVPGRRSPAVLSAFPFAEGQVFDLRNSDRSRVEFLLEVAAMFERAGVKMEAQQLIRSIRQFQKDVATANLFPVVVPSADASTLTYRFDPEAIALLDPTAPKSAAGRLLQPTSFPALIVVVCEDEELEDWTHLGTTVETSWIPMRKRHWFNKGLVDWWRYSHAPSSPQDNDERMGAVSALEEVGAAMSEIRKRNADSEIYFELKRRYEEARSLVLGRSHFTSLPPLPMAVTAVTPSSIEQGDGAALFEILGHGLAGSPRHGELSEPIKVSIGGIRLELVSSDATRITVQFAGKKWPASLIPGTNDLVVESLGGISRLTNGIVISTKSPVSADTLTLTGGSIRYGYRNASTTFTINGAGFLGGKSRQPVNAVIIGDRACPDFKVLNDTTLLVTVPKWGDKVSPPFDTTADPALLVVASNTQVASSDNRYQFVFDRLVTEPKPEKPTAPDNEDAKKLQQQFEALKSLATALGKSPQLLGEIKLATGNSEPPQLSPMPNGGSIININSGNQANPAAPGTTNAPNGK